MTFRRSRNIFRDLPLVAAMIVVAAVTARASGPPGDSLRSVRGTVVSSEDRQPIAGANVFVGGTLLGTATAGDGRFLLRGVPPGRFALVVSIIGFRRYAGELAAGDSGIVIALEPAAVQTAPVTVTANRHEQSLEEVPVSVSFVDERQLEVRNTVTVDDALKYVPGVNITRGQVNVRGSTGFSYGVGTRVLL